MTEVQSPGKMRRKGFGNPSRSLRASVNKGAEGFEQKVAKIAKGIREKQLSLFAVFASFRENPTPQPGPTLEVRRRRAELRFNLRAYHRRLDRLVRYSILSSMSSDIWASPSLVTGVV